MDRLNRREFLKRAGSAFALTPLGTPLLAACQTTASAAVANGAMTAPGLTSLPTPGSASSVREFDLTAAVTPVDVGTGQFQAWTYNGQAVGPEIRVTEGETIRVTLTNNLPDPTTIHWHGIPVPNNMDGVPNVTQPPVQPGETFGASWQSPSGGAMSLNCNESEAEMSPPAAWMINSIKSSKAGPIGATSGGVLSNVLSGLAWTPSINLSNTPLDF